METKKKKGVLTEEARRFKVIRKEANLTQVDMAKILGVTQGAINKYEIGEVFIPTKVYKKLHEKLHYSYEYLMNGKAPKKIVKDKKENTLTNVQELNQKYDILNQKFEELNAKISKLYRDFYSKDT